MRETKAAQNAAERRLDPRIRPRAGEMIEHATNFSVPQGLRGQCTNGSDPQRRTMRDRSVGWKVVFGKDVKGERVRLK